MTQEYWQLQKKIRDVRTRLKWIVCAKGLAISLAFSLLILAIAVFCADHWNYTSSSVNLARLFSALGIGAVFGWFFLRPLLRKVEDVRIARYIEERYPTLQDRLVSAVELGKSGASDSETHPLLPLLIQDAVERSRNISTQSLFNSREPYLSSAIAFALILFFVLLQVFGPDFFQYATVKLYANWLTPQAVSFYRIEVSPGNSQIRKGSDQLVTARLIGFDSNDVRLYSRLESGPNWEKRRMEPEKGANGFGFLFVDIGEKVHYYAESGNVRSLEFSLDVTEVARVERIDLTYDFPRYTGLPSRKEEDGGEISAVKETRVDVQAQTNIDAASARILLQDGSAIAMQRTGDKQFVGQIEVKKDSSYKIELTDSARNSGIGSHEYPISALDDQPPLISILKPGRDKKVTQLEEVLAEVKANDDFGLNSLKFYYTVNGGRENVIDLFQRAKGDAPKTISGTHTFFLEEFGLEPGDFISYHAGASDARTTTTSDIYFLEVRPFGKEYSQSQSGGSAMPGGAGEAGSVLSARQKEILAATWRLIRDRKTFAKTEYSDSLKLVASQQQKLQQQTRTLSERIQRRALTSRDKEFQKLADNLLKAIESMTPAQQMLSQEKPKDAVSPEQTALQHLMRAEAFFRKIQVAFGSNAAGGGNAVGAQELENLFELELDKLKNQYETQQQRDSKQANAEVDEALQKLKELAQRQQQLNERKRQQMQGSSQGGGGSQSEQQMIQEETEKLARQLERLSRETKEEELMNSSQRLKQAAKEMKNSKSNSPTGTAQNGGLQALSRLNDARRMMENQQKNSVSEDLKKLGHNAEQLAQRQEKIQEALNNLTQNSQSKADNGSPQANATTQLTQQFQKKRQIFQDKAELNKALGEMEQNLLDSARKTASQQKATSQQLQAAGNSLRDNRIQDRVTQGGQLIARGMLDIARERERTVQGLIDNLKDKIASAEKGLDKNPDPGASPEERLNKALSQTGNLLENLQSLNRRLQEKRGGSAADKSSQKDSQQARDGEKGSKEGPADSEEGKQASNDGKSPGSSSKSDQPSKSKANGQEGKTPSTQQMNAQGQPGPEMENSGESSGGKTGRDSSRRAQTKGDSASSARENGSTRDDNRQNAFGDGDQQHYGSSNRGNAAVNFGDAELAPPGRITPEQARQFEREYELRFKEAQEIGKNLRDRQDLTKQVQSMVDRMKQMKSMKFLHDEQELERLQSSVIEGFRQLEFDLSRNLQHLISKENLHLAKDEEVPEAYRRQVEDYYKALSKK